MEATMKIETEIISRETIKPTSPTPHHLKTFKISLLDQIVPPVYAPAVLYFSPYDNIITCENRIQLLKTALSSTLTLFYPYAGVIKDALSVDCNDQGLPFIVAKVKGVDRLRDFLEKPDTDSANALISTEFVDRNGVAGPGAKAGVIQLNCFDCGGMAICVTLAHQLADAATLCSFLRSWSASTRAAAGGNIIGDIICRPDYVAQSSAFPQKADLQPESHMSYPLQKSMIVRKFVSLRYVFGSSAISTLRARSTSASKEGGGRGPTRVDAVSAFVWKCFMMAAAADSSASSDDHKPFLLTQPVNLRRRAEPPFSDDCFGNFLWLAPALCTKPPAEADLQELGREVRKGWEGIDGDFMRRLQNDDDGYYVNLERLRKGIPEEAVWFLVTSWSRIGLYDIDFGWGKTVWVSPFVTGDSDMLGFQNSATLIETSSGEGIEAWVIVEEKYASGFLNNPELNNYASFNPSALP